MPSDNNSNQRGLGRVFIEGGVFALGWIAGSKLFGLIEKGFEEDENEDADEDKNDAPFDDE